MRKAYAYLLGSAIIASASLITESCSKSSSSDDDLIGNWKKANAFGGNARSEAVSFTIGNYAYVGMGTTTTERFRDIWEYNLANDYWTQKADLPGTAPARNSAVAFSIGTKGYLGTGYDGVNALNDFWEFDPASNLWTQKTNFAGSARYEAVGFAADGKGYIACGYDGKYQNNMWEYDPGTDQWTPKASVGGDKRSGAMSFVFNNVPYICSGENNGEIQQDLWMYDKSANKWVEKTKIYNFSSDSYDDSYGTIPRKNGVTFVMGNYVYLTTGENGSINSTTWAYDPVADRWTQKTAFEGTARTGSVAFTLNNRGFVLTGRTGGTSLDNTYEFLPGDTKVDGD